MDLKEIYLPRDGYETNLTIVEALDIINQGRSGLSSEAIATLLNGSNTWRLLINNNLIQENEAMEIVSLSIKHRLDYNIGIVGVDPIGIYQVVDIKKTLPSTKHPGPYYERQIVVAKIRYYSPAKYSISKSPTVPHKVLMFILDSLKIGEREGSTRLLALRSIGVRD